MCRWRRRPSCGQWWWWWCGSWDGIKIFLSSIVSDFINKTEWKYSESAESVTACCYQFQYFAISFAINNDILSKQTNWGCLLNIYVVTIKPCVHRTVESPMVNKLRTIVGAFDILQMLLWIPKRLPGLACAKSSALLHLTFDILQSCTIKQQTSSKLAE